MSRFIFRLRALDYPHEHYREFQKPLRAMRATGKYVPMREVLRSLSVGHRRPLVRRRLDVLRALPLGLRLQARKLTQAGSAIAEIKSLDIRCLLQAASVLSPCFLP